MFTGSAKELTDLARRFTEPANATHRQYEALRQMWESGAIAVPGTDVVALASATPPFSQLCPNWHGTVTLQVLCLAHMDAALKDDRDARAFLDGDLISAFATSGISLEATTALPATASVTS